MRALVLTNLYPPHHYGGYELLCRDTVEAWRANGHDVEVLCTDHRLDDVGDGDDVAVDRVLQFYWRDFEVLRPSPRARYRIERANHAHVTATLDRFAPEVVSVWNFGLLGFPVLGDVIARGIPLVLVIGDLWPCWGPSFDPWTSMFASGARWRRVAGAVVQRATGIATSYPDLGAHALALPASEWLRGRIERDSPFHFDRMRVVPHGFDTGDIPIVGPRSGEFAWQLLLPGRLDERKGWRTAVAALVHLPAASLTLAGGGDEREIVALRALTAELGVEDRVRHIVVERADMGALYRAADVVLFPSEWEEPFGIVGLEAMASATPVVATGTGGSGEYLRDGENCLRFPPGDVAALAAAVQRLAGDAGLRRHLVEGGGATARDFTEAVTVRTLEALHVAEGSSARV